ncbi:MAG: MarR family transcriptional regulator [bacterium]|nr:MarR family transcriptional regulator [bacterium]
MEASEKKVLDAMKKEGKPLRPGEVAEAAKMEKDDVSKLLKKMKNDGVVHSPKRCFYEPV